MLRDIETTATEAQLYLRSPRDEWNCDDDWPHIARFSYEARVRRGDSGRRRVGSVDGYRVTQDWTVESGLELWDEADALDGDVVRYLEALIRELRACERVFEFSASIAMAQRITIVRHVEARPGVDLPDLTRDVVASLAMMDAPVLMLVDPWPMSAQRRLSKGKLEGRANVTRLLGLGFSRMVGSRFLWAWNRELSESLMSEYTYPALLEAKRAGTLDAVLKAPLADESYGPMPPHVTRVMDLPTPEDLVDE